MSNSFNLIDFFRIIWKWKKPILIVTAFGIAGSVVITDPHIMPPCFESHALFYPLNPNLTNSSALFDGGEQSYFGTSSDVDRILSIAGSVPLEMYIVNKFDLFHHYCIDSVKERYPVDAVMEELRSNYTFEKNDKGAIALTVFDHSKDTAALMVNEILAAIDGTNRRLMNDSKKKILQIYQSKMSEKEQAIQVLSDSIFSIKQKFHLYGSVETLQNQIKMMNSEEGISLDAASELVKVLEEKKKAAIRELNNTTALFEQYRSTITDDVSTLYILERAYPSEKKSKPVRWLDVLSAALVAFSVSAIAVLLIERFKYIKAALTNAKAGN